MQNQLLFVLSLSVVIITAFIVVSSDTGPSKYEVDTAVNQAKYIYGQLKAKGTDFSSGPCLSNALMPGWVLDIVHSPRLPTDDLPQNQCPTFREGKAKHFVELDLDGNLVRAR